MKSFVEITKFLLPEEESDRFFLSERISQDPLENYFGQLRARGGQNEISTLQQCVHSANAIHVQKSQALDPVRGNSSQKRDCKTPPIDSTPSPKRRRVKK